MSKFLSTGSSGAITQLQDGTSYINVTTATINGLAPNLPVKSGADRSLTSSLLSAADLDFTPLANPFGGTLQVSSDIQANYDTTPIGLVATNTLAAAALPKTGGALTGNLTAGTNSISCGAFTCSSLTTNSLGAGYVKSSPAGVFSSSASIPQADVTNLTTDLGAKAPTANPMFSGTLQCGTLIASGVISSSGNNIVGGAISCASLYATGTLTASTISATGAIRTPTISYYGSPVTCDGAFSAGTNAISGAAFSCSSLTSSGTLSAAGVTSTGAISAGTNAISGGAVSCSSLTSSGALSAGSIGTGAFTATSVQSSGTMSCGSNSLTCGPLDCGAISATGTLNMNTRAITNIKSLSQPASNNGRLLISDANGGVNESSILQSYTNNGNFASGTIINTTNPLLENGSFTYIQSQGQYGRLVVPGAYSDNGIGFGYDTLGANISNTILSQPNAAGLVIALPRTLGSSVVFTSPDGETWTSAGTSFPLTAVYQIVCSGGNFIAHNNASIYWSTDGINWTFATNYTGTMGCIAPVGGNNLLAVTTTTTLFSSDDGTIWTPLASNALPQFVRYSYYNFTVAFAPATGNTIYYQSAPYAGGFGTAAVGSGGVIGALAHDPIRNIHVAALVNNNLQVYTSFNPPATWTAGPAIGNSYSAQQTILVVNPITGFATSIIQTGGPPANVHVIYRGTTTSYQAGGINTPTLALGSTANTISTISGPLNLTAISGQNVTIASSGAGDVSISSANRPITINAGTNIVTIPSQISAGVARAIIDLNGAGQSLTLTTGAATRTMPLAVSSTLLSRFTCDNATGVLTYTGTQTIGALITINFVTTFNANGGNAAYILFHPQLASPSKGIVTFNGLNAAAQLGADYTTAIVLTTGTTLQLHASISLTSETLTFLSYQMIVMSMLG